MSAFEVGEVDDTRPRADSSDVASRKIFIGGLSYSTDEDKLKRYFRDYGIVQDAVVMKDPVTKRSRGFGFITFFDPSSVDAVLAAEPHVVDGRKVEAKRAVPRSEMNTIGVSSVVNSSSTTGKSGGSASSPPSESKSPTSGQNAGGIDESAYNKIFVGGLHYDTRDYEFREYFARFGKVVHGEVMFNRETHKSRGFGFIVYESSEAALRACDVREHILDGKVVEVKLAIPRSKIGTSTPGTPSTAGPGGSSINMTMTPSSTSSARGRTMSASGLSPSVPLSGNSSTLAAAQGSHKIGPGVLSGSAASTMSLRKPASSSGLNQAGASNSRGMAQGSSYASALRIGGTGGGGAIDELLLDDPLAGAYVEDFVIENVRPSRALSEPIVRYEGGGTPTSNSLLSNDVLNFSSFLHQTPPPYPTSQTVSRSNSIALQQPRSSFTLNGSLSPEPIFGSGESVSLAEKLFNSSSNTNGMSGSSLSGLLFPSNDSVGGTNSSTTGLPDLLFSSPSRDGFMDPPSGGTTSRRTSLTGAGGDIWSTGLSSQNASENLWGSGFTETHSSNGLLAAIASQSSYSRTSSKDDGSNSYNPLSSLLQQSAASSGWPSSGLTSENAELGGIAIGQRRHSYTSGSNGDGIASHHLPPSPHSLMSELRMNSHEYGPSGGESTNNNWGAGSRGF